MEKAKTENVQPKERKCLCFRCENRALFLECGMRLRYECGVIEDGSYGCYAYRPVRPIILSKDKKDKRPQFSGILFSARSHYARVAGEEDIGLDVKQYKDGNMLFWIPRKEKKIKKVKNNIDIKQESGKQKKPRP